MKRLGAVAEQAAPRGCGTVATTSSGRPSAKVVAATRIQAMLRRRIAQKLLQVERKQFWAACDIQRGHRGKTARTKYKALKLLRTLSVQNQQCMEESGYKIARSS